MLHLLSDGPLHHHVDVALCHHAVLHGHVVQVSTDAILRDASHARDAQVCLQFNVSDNTLALRGKQALQPSFLLLGGELSEETSSVIHRVHKEAIEEVVSQLSRIESLLGVPLIAPDRAQVLIDPGFHIHYRTEIIALAGCVLECRTHIITSAVLLGGR